MLPTFSEWMAQIESTAFTRRRDGAAKGLYPQGADDFHRHSTYPWAPSKKKRKKKKKSSSKE